MAAILEQQFEPHLRLAPQPAEGIQQLPLIFLDHIDDLLFGFEECAEAHGKDGMSFKYLRDYLAVFDDGAGSEGERSFDSAQQNRVLATTQRKNRVAANALHNR